MVLRLHGDRDVRDRAVDPLLGTLSGLVAEYHLGATLVGLEVRIAVGPDEPAQSHSHIQKLELRPEVYQAVACRSSCKAYDALHHRTPAHQCPEALGAVVLERRELVDDHHVVVEGKGALLDQPLHVLTVDDVQVRLALQRRDALGSTSHRHRGPQQLKVVPLADLARPRVPCHPKRRDDQYLVYLKGVEE